jgi:hypothetical protein
MTQFSEPASLPAFIETEPGRYHYCQYAKRFAVVVAAAVVAAVVLSVAPAHANDGDMIIWIHYRDGFVDAAVVGGDLDLDLWRKTADQAGYCSKVARAADNPGYNVEVHPAPPLNKVIATAGDCR